MTHAFSILAGCREPSCCAVYRLPDALPKPMRAAVGLPMVDQCPQDLELRMADEAPGIQIPDAIDNALGYLLVSGRLRALLEAETEPPIEFLPFRLIDHKGRVAADDTAIGNVLLTVDCIDRNRSRGIDNPLRPHEFMRLERLELRPDAIPRDVQIFRLATRPSVILIRDDLRAAMDAAGMRVTYHELATEVYL
jgi:hypothetical protein